MTHASATLAVYPPSRPTTPKMWAPRSEASSKARTRFTDTWFSWLPPPTENTSTPSRRRRAESTRSHSTKVVSQPSSLVRAVNSDTLSVGAYGLDAAQLAEVVDGV